MRKIFSLCSALIICSVWVPEGAAEEDRDAAPFGLKWGMTTADARSLGIDLQDAPIKEFGITYGAAKLPKVIADISTVIVSFGFDDRLWRIAAISKEFPNDPYGAATKERYSELVRILGEKYGRGVQHHQDAPYRKPEYFLMEINGGRAWDYTDYSTSTLWIQIALAAKDSSTGYYRIIFENRSLGSDFQNSKKLREKNAL